MNEEHFQHKFKFVTNTNRNVLIKHSWKKNSITFAYESYVQNIKTDRISTYYYDIMIILGTQKKVFKNKSIFYE